MLGNFGVRFRDRVMEKFKLFRISLLGSTTGCEARSICVCVGGGGHRNLSWLLSGNRNLRDLGMPCVTTASPESFFRAPWGGWVTPWSAEEQTNTGWTVSKTGRPFSWWGCYGLCLRHKPAELAHSFLFCSCVCFCLDGPFNCISFHKVSQQLSAFSLCSGLYFCCIGPFNYISLYESLLQP